MSKKNILLIYGGGGTEHEISIRSSKYLIDQLSKLSEYQVFSVEIKKNHDWVSSSGENCSLQFDRTLKIGSQLYPIHAAIPCIHGPPGETGDIQSYFELINLPYMGCGPESSKICFNKISTKLWLESIGINTTPFILISAWDEKTQKKVEQFRAKWGNVFVKASNQGSSVGCYPVNAREDIGHPVALAFQYSPFVLIEKKVSMARELEVAVYNLNQKVEVSDPGEIISPGGFYSYDEKYSNISQTETVTRAEGLTPDQIKQIKDCAKEAFTALKLRHLSRVDFFLEKENLYLNEINTFPGCTSISLFPKMMEENGHNFSVFLKGILDQITG